MRGKLRDKPTNARQYRLRRELMERRRPAKRENRATTVLSQQWDEDDELLDVDKELLAISQKQKK